MKEKSNLEGNQEFVAVLPSEDVIEEWNKQFKEGVLAGVFLREHWKNSVPDVYQDVEGLDSPYDEKRFVEELEKFILGDCSLEELFRSEGPPAVCGKVFHHGDVSYMCKDCALDPFTCVMCVQCFKQSIHRNHNYRISSSCGGGCCDCGDTEAWTAGARCAEHQTAEDSPAADLPPDLAERAKAVFETVLLYCVEVLTLGPSLPSSLQPNDENARYKDMDSYCVVLYGHEVYSFGQVATALSRVLKCSHKRAMKYLTKFENEGRSVVYCSDFGRCFQLQMYFEKYNALHASRPLKVALIPTLIIVHQTFALALLNWLHQFLTTSKAFRKIVAAIALNLPSNSDSIVEKILLHDTLFWKQARMSWHQLIISGIFMEYENKKAFSRTFTDNYTAVVKNFIEKDNDYKFSIASLSIQIFTVPTLALSLIAHDDVLIKLLNTFLSECYKITNNKGKLEFDGSICNGSFKRAQYILHDLRHLLHTIPEPWSHELRRGFFQGLSLLINLFGLMHEMNSATRKVGQHLEYEPEWKTAFNLHAKVLSIITITLRWCTSDHVVFMKAYRATLKELSQNSASPMLTEYWELAGHKAKCLKYDVNTQPVSIHLPLSRFFAGLFLHLQQFGFAYFSPDFNSLQKPSPEQLIEPVLRTQAMLAQVHAGMWRRNGYFLLNQIYYYQDVKYRREMYDKDIVLLQIGASLIDSNEFLIHVLNKFGLMNWTRPEFEISSMSNEEVEMKAIVKVVEEFLSLVITIIVERYCEGVGRVTAKDCLRNEIIHQLLIKPLSHSELTETLPDDLNNNQTSLETVVNEVATFKMPNQSGKGIYVLKDEFFDKYNPFFYHYSKEDMTKSEEEQRRRRKLKHGMECCPPPVFPSLESAFRPILNLLKCDVMLHIMMTVIERTLNINSKSYSEGQIYRILYLIACALQEEEQDQTSIDFTARSNKWCIKKLLQQLYYSQRVEAHRDLVQWIISKFSILSPCESCEEEIDCSQGGVDHEQENEKAEESVKARLAAKKRAAILAQMETLQRNFLKENAPAYQLEHETSDFNNSVGINKGDQPSSSIFEKRRTCIICQEEDVVEPHGTVMILAAFVQRSAVLVRNRAIPVEYTNSVLSSNIGPAHHVSTCGHVMHSSCWKKYIDTLLMKQNSRPYRLLKQQSTYDIAKQEYLCPLCERLSNAALPLMPHLSVIKGILYPSTSEQLTSDTDQVLKTVQTLEADRALKTDELEKYQFMEINEVLKTEAMETDEVIETYQVRETDEVFEKHEVLKTDRDLETDQVLSTDQVPETEVFETYEALETDRALEADQALETNRLLEIDEELEKYRVMEINEVHKRDQVLETDRALKTDEELGKNRVMEINEVLKTDEAMETDEVIETYKVRETGEAFEKHKVLKTDRVLKTDQVAETDEVFETYQVLETDRALETYEVLEIDRLLETDEELEKYRVMEINEGHKRYQVLETDRALETDEELEKDQVMEINEVLETDKVIEKRQVLKTDRVLETDQLLKTDEVVKTDGFLETYQVLETDRALETDQVLETELALETDQVLETELALETDQVLEAIRVLETDEELENHQVRERDEVHETDQVLEIDRVLETHQILKTDQVLEANQVMKTVSDERLDFKRLSYLINNSNEKDTHIKEESHFFGLHFSLDDFIKDTEKKGKVLEGSGKLSGELLTMLSQFIDSILRHQFEGSTQDTTPSETGTSIPLVVWNTCSYTIHSIEWVLRYSNKPLFGVLTSQQEENLENLIGVSSVLWVVQEFRNSILSTYKQLLKHSYENCIVDWDSFGTLVPLTFINLQYQNFSVNINKNLLKTILLCNFCKIIICSDMTEYFLEDENESVHDETKCLIDIIKIFKDCERINTAKLWTSMRELSRPFLRCCALFYHFLFGLPVPGTLKNDGGDTYENLIEFLGLPEGCRDMFNDSNVISVLNLLSVGCIKETNGGNLICTNELIPLPDDYSDLINGITYYDVEKIRNPTLCLVCGHILCWENYSCQETISTSMVEWCTEHTYLCGAGVGVFLRVRDCTVMLLSGLRGCLLPAPYLDRYGEEDFGLHRGDPLRLSQANYRQLQLLWLGHSVQEHIARTTEASLGLVHGQWHQL